MQQTSKRLAGCLALTAVLVSCGAPGAPIPPALELPRAVTDLRAARKGENVSLAWTIPTKTTESQSIRHMGPTRICRTMDAAADCKHPIAEITPSQLPASTSGKSGSQSPTVVATYVDILARDLETKNPTSQIAYAVEVLNSNGRSAGLSNQVKVPAAPTLPAPENFAAQLTAQGVLLSWSCASASGLATTSDLRYRVRAYRRAEGAKEDTRAGEADGLDCSHLSLLDQAFEWETNYTYHAAIVAIVAVPGKPEIEVEGDNTPEIKVFTHDVFPPAVPTDLQAAFSGEGQAPFVDLIWAPDTDADLAGYNVFRHEEGGNPVRINSETVKTPAYRDSQITAGKKYFYSVSAVDVRGNESARSEEASEQVP